MNSDEIRLKLVAVARSQVGVRESANNTGSEVAKYQMATWLKPGPWPWCAAFVSWCVREWLRDPAVLAHLQFKNPSEAELWRCKDARAYGWEEWAWRKVLGVYGDTAEPKVGDVVTYDFSHVGIVAEVHKGHIITIEGNTNGEGSREGDGVYIKKRSRGIVRKYIRLVP